MNPSNLLKSKMKKIETKFYVKWIIEEIKKDRASFNEFSKRKGIIATRGKFLKRSRVWKSWRAAGVKNEKMPL